MNKILKDQMIIFVRNLLQRLTKNLKFLIKRKEVTVTGLLISLSEEDSLSREKAIWVSKSLSY